MHAPHFSDARQPPAHLSVEALNTGMPAISSSSSCSRGLKWLGRLRVVVHRSGSCQGGGGHGARLR